MPDSWMKTGNLTRAATTAQRCAARKPDTCPETRRNLKGRPFGVGFGCLPQSLQEETPSMDSKKYIGMDVHKESISIAAMNGAGKIVMECVIETKASMILQFFDGLRGDLQVTFEEGTSAAWLYDLLKPHVTKLVVCHPRKNASTREGNQNDQIDARRLAELLRLNHRSITVNTAYEA